MALAFRYNLFMEAITVNGRAPLSKITCLQLQRIDVKVRHVHIARPCDWLRLAAVRSAPRRVWLCHLGRKEGKSPLRPETDLRSASDPLHALRSDERHRWRVVPCPTP